MPRFPPPIFRLACPCLADVTGEPPPRPCVLASSDFWSSGRLVVWSTRLADPRSSRAVVRVSSAIHRFVDFPNAQTPKRPNSQTPIRPDCSAPRRLDVWKSGGLDTRPRHTGPDARRLTSERLHRAPSRAAPGGSAQSAGGSSRCQYGTVRLEGRSSSSSSSSSLSSSSPSTSRPHRPPPSLNSLPCTPSSHPLPFTPLYPPTFSM
jgi:hypothetical protein